jgi:hypothetical protein
MATVGRMTGRFEHFDEAARLSSEDDNPAG